MSIPTTRHFRKPLLELLANEGPLHRKVAAEKLAEKLQISEREREERTASGKDNLLQSRVDWAATFLVQAGLASRPSRGVLEITDMGRSELPNAPDVMTSEYMMRFPSFREFIERTEANSRIRSRERLRDSSDQEGIEDVVSGGDDAPLEQIARVYRQLVETVASELLQRLRSADPAFFERAVLDLLEAMGYGEGTVTGRSGDGGIDGIVSRDPLGLEPLYMQAKRYGESASVGPDAIQAFYGALSMSGRSATSGVFFTTARFTKGAIAAAEQLPARIVLIDGQQLAGLMVRHGVGVREAERFVVPELDEGYFE